jgi:hypothetical protein
MFVPTRDQVRQFFIDTWARHRRGEPLEPLQCMALEVIALHPEYHGLLERPERFRDRDYAPETGTLNPFLHLSLHLAVSEQLSIDQPRGIRAQFERMLAALGDRHAALHALLECLGETLWQAQRLGGAPDESAYLECLRRRGAK